EWRAGPALPVGHGGLHQAAPGADRVAELPARLAHGVLRYGRPRLGTGPGDALQRLPGDAAARARRGEPAGHRDLRADQQAAPWIRCRADPDPRDGVVGSRSVALVLPARRPARGLEASGAGALRLDEIGSAHV